MSATLTGRPMQNLPRFMDFDVVLDLEGFDADIAILDIPYGDPYTIDEVSNDQSNAPTAVRRASIKAPRQSRHRA